ncbi:transposase [Capnocytophaga canimorsus]|uniref:transposase n=1 Tax=Capnocytophaga canimorsus TaxID=28188 RepID=UPI0037D60201
MRLKNAKKAPIKTINTDVMWNNLSDVKVEEHVNHSLSAMKFCGMQLEDNVTIYSVLSRFRPEITEKKAFDSLLSEINHQLEKHRIIIHQGVKVDASIMQLMILDLIH